MPKRGCRTGALFASGTSTRSANIGGLHTSRAFSASVGISHKLSSESQKLAAVPELTRSADVQLNERVSLPIALGILSSTIVVLDGRQDPSRPYAPARLGVAVGFEEGDGGPAVKWPT
jgi:hypothetical protein